MHRPHGAVHAVYRFRFIALFLMLAACSAVDAPISSNTVAAPSPEPLVDLPNCPEDLSSASVRVYCLFNSAVLLRDNGYPEQAKQEFLNVLSVDENHVRAHQYLGDIYFEEDDLESAAQMYRGVVALDGTRALVHENLGVVYDRSGEPELAIESYLNAIRLRPANPETHYKLGLAYTRDRATMNEAIAAFERAIELDASKANYHFNLAQVYEYIGRETRAESHYRMASELGYSP